MEVIFWLGFAAFLVLFLWTYWMPGPYLFLLVFLVTLLLSVYIDACLIRSDCDLIRWGWAASLQLVSFPLEAVGIALATFEIRDLPFTRRIDARIQAFAEARHVYAAQAFTQWQAKQTESGGSFFTRWVLSRKSLTRDDFRRLRRIMAKPRPRDIVINNVGAVLGTLALFAAGVPFIKAALAVPPLFLMLARWPWMVMRRPVGTIGLFLAGIGLAMEGYQFVVQVAGPEGV